MTQSLTTTVNPVTSMVTIALYGNNIIKINDNIIYVCNGNYRLTPTTKRAIVATLGGSFAGSNYVINGRSIDLSSDWQAISDVIDSRNGNTCL